MSSPSVPPASHPSSGGTPSTAARLGGAFSGLLCTELSLSSPSSGLRTPVPGRRPVFDRRLPVVSLPVDKRPVEPRCNETPVALKVLCPAVPNRELVPSRELVPRREPVPRRELVPSLELVPIRVLLVARRTTKLSQTTGVSSETVTKAAALASSPMIRSLVILSSSQGAAAIIEIPSWLDTRRAKAFLDFAGSKAHRCSSAPPLKESSCTKASPAGPRIFECSLASPRKSKGSKRARLKRPTCCNPKALRRRCISFKFAERPFCKVVAPPFQSLLLPASSFKRSWMRDISKKANSSRGTFPCKTQEHNVSLAACCDDVLAPASSTSSTVERRLCSSPFSSQCPGCSSKGWHCRRAVNSSGPRMSARASHKSSSKTAREATKTLATLSFAAITMMSLTAFVTSAGEPDTSLKFLDK
mmetsp:Transcript_11858/g.26996  ORF Transcript_11858/g.26996 Transcript_11858/m.26996 type:complete len:416 (-) Transcript_11858:1624-2871(-)